MSCMQRLGAIVVLIVLAIGGYVAYQYQVTKQIPDLKKAADTFAHFTSQVSDTSHTVKIPETDATQQLQVLSQRAGEVGQHAQNVLGSSIQVNESVKKPIHESAIEYGRYVYCKQVVTDYENSVEKNQ